MLMSMLAMKDTAKQDLELISKHSCGKKKLLHISRVKTTSINSDLTSVLHTEVEGGVL